MQPTAPIIINTFSEFLLEVANKQGDFKTFIYRGQSDEVWDLVSGVHRRIRDSKKKKSPSVNVYNGEIIEYLEKKLIEVRKRITSKELSELYQTNDIDIMVEMQHYGGATNLLDFTHSALISLYFASADNFDKNGKIYCINTDDGDKVVEFHDNRPVASLLPISEGKIYLYSPNHNNRRILKQDSVFLFPDSGSIKEELVDTIFIINAASKEQILKELKWYASITEESIYPDFLGYLLANSSTKPFIIPSAHDYYQEAKNCQSKKEYQRAIKYYNLSIKKAENENILLEETSSQYMPYLQLSKCLHRLGYYPEAIENCKKAESFNNDVFRVWSELAVLYTLTNNFDEAKMAFEKAKHLKSTPREEYLFKYNQAYLQLCNWEFETSRKTFLELLNDKRPFHEAVNIGHTYLLENNVEKAEEYYRMALKDSSTEDNTSFEYSFREAFELDYKSTRMEKKGIPFQIISEVISKVI
ncbi:MAG TPA: FRG domain-containing protein [Mucilaginibacter sp.]|jgi:tetratricopeptide (TPR) repeat protein|nr:FRG domain-containing protein [Mucilaginibacter sp.]